MTENDVHNLVIQWIAGLTGAVVIKADQQGDEPVLPYIMVRLTGVAEVRENSQDTLYEEDIPSGDVLATPVIEREWRFSVHAYASEPTALLRPLSVADDLDQTLEPLAPVNLYELSAIRLLPEFINQKYESRAQIDITLRGLTKDGMLINTIEEFSTQYVRV